VVTGQYAVLPSIGTCGGLILACSKDFYSISHVDIKSFSVMVTITRRVDSQSWTMTGVYGPQAESDKVAFMQELKEIQQTTSD
jgi:hypothetical protein